MSPIKKKSLLITFAERKKQSSMSPFLTLKLWSVIPFKIDQTPKVFFSFRPNDLTDPNPGIGSTKKNEKKDHKPKIANKKTKGPPGRRSVMTIVLLLKSN